METKDVGTTTDLGLSLRQTLGGSVLIIALVAAIFWAIGAVVGPDDDPVVVADGVDAPDASADEADPPSEEPAPRPEPEPEPDPGTQEDETGSESEPDPEPEADPDEEPAEPPVESVAPGDVTVQVLDGLETDGGAAASSVAEALESAGYEIVARNPAIRSDVTAVLWTSGNEDAARQVAAEIGAAEVRRQPGTLSDSVAVHVVVGADRA